MTPDELAFIKAIVTVPADDTPRLVFADWLVDTCVPPRPDRAEFIHVQCELARLTSKGGGKHGEDGHAECPGCVSVRTLRRRERELLLGKPAGSGVANWVTWKAGVFAGNCVLLNHVPDSEFVRDGDSPGVLFTRGFISSVTCTAADFLRIADSLCWGWGQCGRCGGSGGVKVAGGVAMDCDETDCPACHGSGRVPPTMACPTCSNWSEDTFARNTAAGIHTKCTGRVPRPCPATAQPVTDVTLTTWPELENHRGDYVPHAAVPWNLAAMWPGIKFTLPNPYEGLTAERR